MFQTYAPSGRFSPSFVIWLVLGFLAVALAAVVYALGLRFIPFIYVSFLLTLGMGWVVGLIGQWIVKQGKVRNVAIGFGIAVFLALSALGVKFATQYYLDYQKMKEVVDRLRFEDVMEPGDPRPTPEQLEQIKQNIKNNYGFLQHIQSRVVRGWNAGRGGRNGMPLASYLVYLVWLIEAGMILYFAVPAVMTAARLPFAEQLDTWADEAEVVMMLPITDDEMVQNIQAANSVQDLLELPIPKTDLSSQFAVYTVNSIPGQEFEDAYLTVDLHEYSVDKEGKTEVKIKPLAKMVVITAQQRVQLKENADLMKEAMEAYRASLLEEQALTEAQPEEAQ